MHDAAQDFVERVSLLLEDYGLSRIAGRMLGHFLICGESHSLDEIAEQLQVSKGSASTNARLLERKGFLERRGRPGDRRDFYCLAKNPWRNMLEVARQRMNDMSSLFASSADELPPDMDEACERLRAWSEFYAFVLRDLDRQAQRWETHRTEQQSSN